MKSLTLFIDEIRKTFYPGTLPQSFFQLSNLSRLISIELFGHKLLFVRIPPPVRRARPELFISSLVRTVYASSSTFHSVFAIDLVSVDMTFTPCPLHCHISLSSWFARVSFSWCRSKECRENWRLGFLFGFAKPVSNASFHSKKLPNQASVSLQTLSPLRSRLFFCAAEPAIGASPERLISSSPVLEVPPDVPPRCFGFRYMARPVLLSETRSLPPRPCPRFPG